MGGKAFAYGQNSSTPNTFIGGVSAVISTATILASTLGILESRILGFTIIGSDIQCRIKGTYAIPITYFLFPSTITYYDDVDGLVSNPGYVRSYTNLHTWNTPNAITIGLFFGRECPLLTVANFPNATSVTGSAFYSSNCSTFNLNSALTLGTTIDSPGTADSVFYLIPTGSVINVPIALATVNSGTPDTDLVYAVSSRSATVNYI